uniref:Intraflagellar transport protein 80 homolog n=1 Tax=Syphacia muris TaxID=451379 RepID=A0A0N5A873_9BILA
MRLKIGMARECEHNSCVCAVCWTNSEEVISCGDDHQLFFWNMTSFEAQQTIQFSEEIFPTTIEIVSQAHASESVSNTFVITSTNGKIYFFNRNGRFEKAVNAHNGAVLCGKWSYDYSSYLTCGEDGYVKMWSRNGMLRSNIAQSSSSVYSVAWSSDNSQIIYCSREYCFIKPLKSQANTSKWKAHDGVVLCLDWSRNTDLIISGGEDCKYKVWDSYGRQLYSSSSHGYPVTSLSWNKDGDLFAVGSYNLLRLCDKAGWSHSLDKLSTQSILNISWSPDSTQLIGACSNGHIVHAHIVERRVMWKNLEATQTRKKFIDVRDVVSDVGQEKLETKDRITKIALGFHHLVVATTKQCYIFSSDNWNTPIINDLKEYSVTLILLCEQYFLLVDGSLVQIWTYEGRVQCILKIPNNIQGDSLNAATTALSNDTVALRDRIDRSLLRFYETINGQNAGDGDFKHSTDIIEITLEQHKTCMEQHLAFIDKTNSCYLLKISTYGRTERLRKLGTTIIAIRFNDSTNMLSGLQEDRLIIWGYPVMAFVDKELLSKTIIERELENLGKSASLITYFGNHVSIRRSDAALIPCAVPPFALALWRYTTASKWDQALKLCRHIQKEYLWGMLAGMAISARNMEIAEVANAALNEVEKVFYIHKIQTTTDKNLKSSLIALFVNDVNGADSTMIRSGHVFEAIMFNVSMFRWKRALELAVHYKQHIDTVIGYRQRYLRAINRTETDKEFLKQLAEVEVDWNHIQDHIRANSSVKSSY